MMKPLLTLATSLAVSLAALNATQAQEDSAPADMILKNGAVYTVDAARTWAEAVAIRDGEIVYVGSDKGAERYSGDETQNIDLEGRMLLPSFQDIHIHPAMAGVEYLACALFDGETKEDYLAIVKKCVEENPDKAWIRGTGWLLDGFLPSGIPHKDFLDAIEPNRPIILGSADGHTLWTNSKAMELAGITKDTVAPGNGRVEKDPETGEPIGVFQEDPAMNLVLDVAPPYSKEELRDGLRWAQKELNRLGITAIQDAIVKLDGKEAYTSLPTYASLNDNDELTLRVRTALFWDPAKDMGQLDALKQARSNYTKGLVNANSIKIWYDGVIETDTAAMLEPYTDPHGHNSEVVIPPEETKKVVTALDKEGFQVHFHAIGDAAIRYALDAIEAARTTNGIRDSRHHISHLEFISPPDVTRFRELDVIANFQPLWAYEDSYITELTYPKVGPERSQWIYLIGSLYRDGAVVAFGSDWSVSSANPLEGIEVALTRLSAEGETTKPLLPDERIELADAIASYTIRSAHVNFLDDKTGSIEVGKLADLIVLDKNLFTIPKADISEAKVLLTLLGGKPVFGNPEDL